MAAIATIQGKNLVITVPLEAEPKLSSTGKTYVVAGTGGFVATELQLQGKTIKLNVCACIKV